MHWLTLKNQLNAFLSQVALEGRLNTQMTALQDLMEAGIRDVQNKSDLITWARKMFSISLDVSTTLGITSNIDEYFIFQHQTLSVADTIEQIADKSLIIHKHNVQDTVNIEDLKRDFVFDQPELVLHASEPGTELDGTDADTAHTAHAPHSPPSPDADTAHTAHAPHSPPPPLPDVSPSTGKRNFDGNRKRAQMPQLLAALRLCA